MRVTLITRWSRGGCWAYCTYKNDVLVESGKSAEDVADKVAGLLAMYHNLDKSAIEFLIQTPAVTKAKNMMRRLRREKKPLAPEVQFNAAYFS